jgi:hypothetical protein
MRCDPRRCEKADTPDVDNQFITFGRCFGNHPERRPAIFEPGLIAIQYAALHDMQLTLRAHGVRYGMVKNPG